MSEIKAGTPLTDQQVQEISGGSCTITDLQDALERLKESYETLVDFTSHVIERVAN